MSIFITSSLQKIAGGLTFAEAPLWHKDGYLLFSDTPKNAIYKLLPDGNMESLLQPSGMHKRDEFTKAMESFFSDQIGSNGKSYDTEGNIIFCQHGNHALAMIDGQGFKIVVENYNGKPLNSPNDLTISQNGAIYFTDPPYLYAKNYQQSHKPQPVGGVYRFFNQMLELLAHDLEYPNGICFSPDEKYLYVSSFESFEKKLWRYEVSQEGKLVNGIVFYPENADGLKTDTQGNLYLCNEKGIIIISPDAKFLELLEIPETPTNLNWGNDEYKTLYITARSAIFSVKVNVAGKLPFHLLQSGQNDSK